MTPSEFIRQRARIESAPRRSGNWRKRAMRRLQRRAEAVPVTLGAKVVGYLMRCGRQVCVKHRYKTQAMADNALQQIALEIDGRQKPVRSYWCWHCSGWHITHKA